MKPIPGAHGFWLTPQGEIISTATPGRYRVLKLNKHGSATVSVFTRKKHGTVLRKAKKRLHVPTLLWLLYPKKGEMDA